MTEDRLFISFLSIALEGTLLAALILRKRYRVCLSFPIYVGAVIVPSFLFAVWPQRFYNWDNYMLREIVHNLLKFAIAFELTYRTMRSFPGAFFVGRRLVVSVLLLVAVVALTVLATPGKPTDLQAEWHARVLNGTIWLFTTIAMVILWYRLPVDPFQKAILVGFVPYLLAFSLVMRAIAEDWQVVRVLQRAHTLGYAALLMYWNWVAWSRQTAPVSVSPRARVAQQPEPA